MTTTDQFQTESKQQSNFNTHQSVVQSVRGSKEQPNGQKLIAGQQQKTEVQIREMCHLVREQAFEKLETSIVVHVLQQIIRTLRSKELQREKVFKHLLGRTGVLKVYHLFNCSSIAELRKLSGRLLIEALFHSISNQDFICELLDFEPLNGRVCLNQELPPLIRQKIQLNAGFLTTVHNLIEAQNISSEKKYWSFPEYREIIVPTSADSMFNTQGSNNKEKDYTAEFSNFPDSSLYMIGFKYRQQNNNLNAKEVIAVQKVQIKEPEETITTTSIIIEQTRVQPTTQTEIFKTSTSNPDFVLNSNPSENREDKPRQKSVKTQKQSLPLFLQKSIQKIHTITHQFKTTTDSTESQNRNGTTGTSGNDSGSQRSYMRHTSNSENRKRSRSNNLQIKSSLVNKNREKASVNLPIKQLGLSYLQAANETIDRSQSPLTKTGVVSSLNQEIPPKSNNPSTDMTKLIKLLNKPEMLLLSHLQNQIKYYYPQRMNKHLQIGQQQQTTQQVSPLKDKGAGANFMETVERQRKIIHDQAALSARSKYSAQPQQPIAKHKLSVGREQKTPTTTISPFGNTTQSFRRDSLTSGSSPQPHKLQAPHVINSTKHKRTIRNDNPPVTKKSFQVAQQAQLQPPDQQKPQTRLKTQTSIIQTESSKMFRESFEVSTESMPVVSAATNHQSVQNTFTTFF